jgi:threonine dehydrogenase-like Zn-dependent dehydrogenase
MPVRKCSAVKTVAELVKVIEADIKDKRSELASTNDADKIAELEVGLVDLISQGNSIKTELDVASHNEPRTGTAVVVGAGMIGCAVVWAAKMVVDSICPSSKSGASCCERVRY